MIYNQCRPFLVYEANHLNTYCDITKIYNFQSFKPDLRNRMLVDYFACNYSLISFGCIKYVTMNFCSSNHTPITYRIQELFLSVYYMNHIWNAFYCTSINEVPTLTLIMGWCVRVTNQASVRCLFIIKSIKTLFV